MTGKSLKHHYALIPLFVIMAVGMAFVTAFIGRLAIYSPDTNWTRYVLPTPSSFQNFEAVPGLQASLYS